MALHDKSDAEIARIVRSGSEAERARLSQASPVGEETPPKGIDGASLSWQRDAKGGMSGRVNVSRKGLVALGGVLSAAGIMVGWLGHSARAANAEPGPVVVGAKVDALESRIGVLELSVSKMDGKLDVLINRKGN